MCAAPLTMVEVSLLGSVAMLVIVVKIEASAYLYRGQTTHAALPQRRYWPRLAEARGSASRPAQPRS